MVADELIKTIDTVFAGVDRPETSLRQFLLTSEYGLTRDITDDEWVHAGKGRVDTKWQDIPDFEIEECNCLLAHMQAEEFQYYLPAYMRYSVKHYQKSIWESDIIGSTVFSLSPISNDSDLKKYKVSPLSLFNYSVSQFSLLTKEHKKVIVEFLEFVARLDDHVQSPHAVKALEQYWSKNVGT